MIDISELRAALDDIKNHNNMDHSMLTAIAAVKSIAGGTVTKADIWNVNAEKNYHEGTNND